MIIIGAFIGIVYSLFMNDTAEFWSEKEMNERFYGPCSMKFVGKKDLDPTAKSIPLIPPVGQPYILFKQQCENKQ